MNQAEFLDRGPVKFQFCRFLMLFLYLYPTKPYKDYSILLTSPTKYKEPVTTMIAGILGYWPASPLGGDIKILSALPNAFLESFSTITFASYLIFSASADELTAMSVALLNSVTIILSATLVICCSIFGISLSNLNPTIKIFLCFG